MNTLDTSTISAPRAYVKVTGRGFALPRHPAALRDPHGAALGLFFFFSPLDAADQARAIGDARVAADMFARQQRIALRISLWTPAGGCEEIDPIAPSWAA